jgi:hypothetical protein
MLLQEPEKVNPKLGDVTGGNVMVKTAPGKSTFLLGVISKLTP